jgi:hypothetical protein
MIDQLHHQKGALSVSAQNYRDAVQEVRAVAAEIDARIARYEDDRLTALNSKLKEIGRELCTKCGEDKAPEELELLLIERHFSSLKPGEGMFSAAYGLVDTHERIVWKICQPCGASLRDGVERNKETLEGEKKFSTRRVQREISAHYEKFIFTGTREFLEKPYELKVSIATIPHIPKEVWLKYGIPGQAIWNEKTGNLMFDE